MSNPSSVGSQPRPVILAIALQMRVANRNPAQANMSTANRIAHAIGKAQQSSPAMRRNPVAVQALANRLRPLASGNAANNKIKSAVQGARAVGAARTITRDAVKAFRKGEGKIDIKANHAMSDRAARHGEAAARGLRRGGLGLLSAAYHGAAAVSEMRKTTREMQKAFKQGEGKPEIKSSHELSKHGSAHADAAAAGLRRGGLGLLSAAYHGVQALRDLRRSAHGQGAKQSAQTTHALTPMSLSTGSSQGGSQRSHSLLESLGPERMHAIGQGLQALAMAHQGQGGRANSGQSPLAVMLIARTQSHGGQRGPSSHPRIEELD